MKPATIFSQDRRFRYTLWRDWPVGQIALFDPHPDYYAGRPDTFVQFIGLNPSKADEVRNDNTISILTRFAQSWGFGGMVMTNLFAYRSTDPKKMKDAMDPIGPDNDRWLIEHARAAGLVVACWSAHGSFKDRGPNVRKMLTDLGVKLHTFGVTENGQPRHPLRMAYNTTLKVYG